MPIINPITIYLMNVMSKIGEMAPFILIFSVFILALLFVTPPARNNSEDKRQHKVIMKIATVTATISLFLSIFIPSRDTMIAMIVAKHVTIENIQSGQEIVKGSIDYIFEKINELDNK